MRTGRTRGFSVGGFHDLAYVDWGDPGAARTVVCVHGLSRQGRDFDALAQALAADGYRVVCPDLPGRGLSGRLADPALYAPPHYAQDIAALFAHLGGDAFDLVGTSLGGVVGMMLAASAGSPIRRLVVNDVGPFIPQAAVRAIGENLRATPKRFASLAEGEARLRAIHAGFGPLTDAQWRGLAAHSFKETPDGGFEPHFDPRIGDAFAPEKIADASFWPVWDMISCPVLLLRGERSDLLLPETADEMTRRGPAARLETVPDCGHAPALLEAAQIDLVRAWLGPAV